MNFVMKAALRVKVIADGLHSLDGEGYTLTDADTHSGERAAAASFLQLVNGGEDKARATHAERMAQRNRTTIRIHMRSVIGEAQLTQTG